MEYALFLVGRFAFRARCRVAHTQRSKQAPRGTMIPSLPHPSALC